MELNNLFPNLYNIHNFAFTGQFDKHNYYKDIDLFKNLNINNIKSNPKWNCKLQTNFPGDNIGLLNSNIVNELYKDIFIHSQFEDYFKGENAILSNFHFNHPKSTY